MTERVLSQVQVSERGFHGESKFHFLTRCVAVRFENLETSSHYFFESKDLSLDGLAVYKQKISFTYQGNRKRPDGRPRTIFTNYNGDLKWNRYWDFALEK